MTAQPSEQDHQNAETRRRIADRQNAAYDEAQALADAALGPGFQPWMKLNLIDSDHRRTGDTTPVATVFKVYRGELKLTDNSVFIRRMEDDTIRTATSYEPLFGDLLAEKHPSRTVEVRGEQVPVGRYELVWGALEQYEPRSAEQLAAARQTREAKAVEREAQASPLFADVIREEGFQPGRRPRQRS